ncbi:MAG: flagellar hook-length control protein, partial [Labilithrix sp.]|nr:flagellar hook-length control protein [Labilithrix sp.]
MRRVVAAAVSSVAIVLASRANAEPPVAVKTWPGGEVASITVAKSGKVFVGTFIEDRAVMPPSRNGELYVTDGTPAGTTRVASLGPTPGYFSAHVFPFRDDVLFGLAPDSLWSSDGTPDGTARVADVFTTGGIALGSRIVFRAEGDGRMWATDGTTSGTAPLTACATAATLVGTTAAGALFAAEACPGSAGFDGLTLWSTDGTPAGTVPIKDISPNGQPVVMLRVRSASGQVFFATFSAVDAGTGGSAPLKLWRTDGTSNGTTLIASPS